jgi:hypothetical protein
MRVIELSFFGGGSCRVVTGEIVHVNGGKTAL